MKNADQSVLLKQYEMAFKNVEYLDSYVTKSMAIYIVFIGAIITNIEKLSPIPKMMIPIIIFVVFVSAFLYLVLYRISRLIEQQINSAQAIEEYFKEHSLSQEAFSPIPVFWGKGMSTSRLSRYGIIGLALIVLYPLLSSVKWCLQ